MWIALVRVALVRVASVLAEVARVAQLVRIARVLAGLARVAQLGAALMVATRVEQCLLSVAVRVLPARFLL